MPVSRLYPAVRRYRYQMVAEIYERVYMVPMVKQIRVARVCSFDKSARIKKSLGVKIAKFIKGNLMFAYVYLSSKYPPIIS